MNENNKRVVQIVLGILIIIGIVYVWSIVGVDKKADEMVEQKLSFDPTLLVGTWVNVDDENFKRTFNTDGTFTDTYKNEKGPEVSVSGTWNTFDKEDRPTNFNYPVGDGAIFVTLNDKELSTNFVISEVTKDSLTMVYLENASVLKFKKD
ncbi:MAG: hypothetical protein WC087_00865 [Candidatus Paceibacterota bacterium]